MSTNPEPKPIQSIRLLASGPIIDKTLAVTRFTASNINFENWQSPVQIARLIEKSSKKTPITHIKEPDPQKTAEQNVEMRKDVQKSRRHLQFRLEDGAKKHQYIGQLEGGQTRDQATATNSAQERANLAKQSTQYVFLKREGDYFRVLACEDWYNFKLEPKIKGIGLEEAEKLMKGKPTEIVTSDKRVSKIIKKEEQIKTENIISNEFNPTGEKVEDVVDDDEFEKKKQKKKSDKGEDFDFDAEFDDDAEEDKVTINDRSDEENEAKKLSSGGKGNKKLLRKFNEDDFDDEDDDEELPDQKEPTTEQPAATTTNNRRRPRDETVENTPNKRIKLEPGTSAPAGGALNEKQFEKEIREFLEVRGKVELSEIIKTFKTHCNSAPNGKDIFKKIMGKIAEITGEQDQKKYVVLKDDVYKRFR